MAMIKGETVSLHVKTKTGVDQFNKPIYQDTIVNVNNVLIGQPTSEDNKDALDLYGKKAKYTLAIPKGDSHKWEDTEVEFFGRKWKTFGIPVEGIESNIPLEWNKKVMVEAYE